MTRFRDVSDVMKAIGGSDVEISDADLHRLPPERHSGPVSDDNADYVPSEHEEQVAFFQGVFSMMDEWPLLERLCYAIPNGGYRMQRTAVLLREEGVKAGVADIHVAIPRGNYCGLYIELKRSDRKNHATPLQDAFLRAAEIAGHATSVSYGAGEALTVLRWYMGLGEPNSIPF